MHRPSRFVSFQRIRFVWIGESEPDTTTGFVWTQKFLCGFSHPDSDSRGRCLKTRKKVLERNEHSLGPVVQSPIRANPGLTL